MNKKDQLKQVLKKFVGTDDTMLQGYKAFDDGIVKLKEQLQESVKASTLSEVNSKMEDFQSKIDFKPLLEALNTLQSEFDNKIGTLGDELSTKIAEAKQLDASDDQQYRSKNEESLGSINDEISNLRGQLKDTTNEYSKKLDKMRQDLLNADAISDNQIKEQINNVDKKIEVVKQDVILNKTESESSILNLTNELPKLRSELLTIFSQKGGGSMDRQIKVGGTDILTRYTDINLKAGTGVTLSAVNNDTNKNVDITITSGGVSSETLAGVSLVSTDATKSLYTMTSTIPVEFKTSGGSTLLYLDETNGVVGVLTNAIGSIGDKFRVAGTIYGTNNVAAGNAFWFPGSALLMFPTAAVGGAVGGSGSAYTFADNSGTTLKQIKAQSIAVQATSAGTTLISLNSDGSAYFSGNVGVGQAANTVPVSVFKPSGVNQSSAMFTFGGQATDGTYHATNFVGMYYIDANSSQFSINNQAGTGIRFIGNGIDAVSNTGGSRLNMLIQTTTTTLTVGGGSTLNAAKLGVVGDSGRTLQDWMDSSGTVLNTMLYNGNVGVGTPSPNTQVEMKGTGYTATLTGNTSETGTALSLNNNVGRGVIAGVEYGGTIPTINIVPDVSKPLGGLRMGTFSVLGTDDMFFQMTPATPATGYSYFEGLSGLGLVFGTNTTTPILFRPNRVTVARIDGTGFIFPTDNTYDIGASGSTRPRTGYFGTSLILGTNSGSNGLIKLFGSTSGDVTITTAAAAGTATRFQLPADNGTNTYVLQTDGSGNTSWVPPSAGGSGITRVSSVISVSSTMGATSATDYVVMPNVGVAVTLPTAVGNTNLYTVKNIAVSSVLVATTAGETIDGSTTALLPTQYQSLSFISNGSVWGVV